MNPEETISFDTLRYLDPWANLIQNHGRETTLKWLIIWQVLNGWNIEKYPDILVLVFGRTVETAVPELMKNPPELPERFKFIEGEDFPARLQVYCERILKEYKWWSVYDP